MRTRAEIEAEAADVKDLFEGDIDLCGHHNRNLIPGKRRELARRLEALRAEWRQAR